MRWSISLGKIFGINFRIHITFFLLLFFVFVSVLGSNGLSAALTETLFICSVFICVLIHEIGHSLIARRFGKEAKSITLLPIGGVSALEEMPEKPAQEILMAIIGPFINIVIAAVLFIFVRRMGSVKELALISTTPANFLPNLVTVNIFLAVFNLIPAFPMDGGRVFRGFLALWMDFVSATQAAVFVGQAIALFFIFSVFLGASIWLPVIGIFLFLAASGEKHDVVLRSLLHNLPISEVMTTEFISLRPDQPLSVALEHFHHGSQNDFPIIGDSGLEGILTRDRILSSIHQTGTNVPVSEVMDKTFIAVDAGMPLDEVYRKLLLNHKTAVAVIEGDKVAGMVCLDGISKYFMIKSALESK